MSAKQVGRHPTASPARAAVVTETGNRITLTTELLPLPDRRAFADTVTVSEHPDWVELLFSIAGAGRPRPVVRLAISTDDFFGPMRQSSLDPFLDAVRGTAGDSHRRGVAARVAGPGPDAADLPAEVVDVVRFVRLGSIASMDFYSFDRQAVVRAVKRPGTAVAATPVVRVDVPLRLVFDVGARAVAGRVLVIPATGQE